MAAGCPDVAARDNQALPGGGDDSPSPVYGYLRQPSMVDFPGQLAAVLFTSGCNFRCGFCHNAELMGKPQPGMSWERLRQACDRLAADWVDAAVVTGGEPTVSEHLPRLLESLRTRGWRLKLDTNGSNPDMLARCLPLVDYVAMDVKVGLSQYRAVTGFGATERLQTSMELIRERAPDYEFRTTLIETLHTGDQLDEIAALVRGARRHVLQPFIPAPTLPDPAYRDGKRTSPQFVRAASEHFAGAVDDLVVRGT